MKKYTKTSVIEVVHVYEDGSVLVQNEGNPLDRWAIDEKTFKDTYAPVKETKRGK